MIPTPSVLTANPTTKSTVLNEVTDFQAGDKGENPNKVFTPWGNIELIGPALSSEQRSHLISSIVREERGLDKVELLTLRNKSNGDDEEEDSFEIHVGRALGTLRKDYPRILQKNPEFKIYDNDLEVVDPSGVKLNGLSGYKNAFDLVHGVINTFYRKERSGLTFRLCYDTARRNIRIHWNAEVIPRDIFGGDRTALHVDGISVYELSRSTGKIVQHRIERTLINDMPIRQGLRWQQQYENEGQRQTALMCSKSEESPQIGNTIVKFNGWSNNNRKSLFSSKSSTSLYASGGDVDLSDFDWDGYNKKNASRKKFGLKQITPEEYLDIVSQVQEMETHHAAAAANAAAEMSAKAKKNQKRPGFMDKIFGSVLEDTCESNFDCERPQVCCDFGFKKMCCASGTPIFDTQKSLYGQRRLIPVPVDTRTPQGPMGNPPPRDNYPGYPNY